MSTEECSGNISLRKATAYSCFVAPLISTFNLHFQPSRGLADPLTLAGNFPGSQTSQNAFWRGRPRSQSNREVAPLNTRYSTGPASLLAGSFYKNSDITS